jgi:hypothetical protein
MLHLCDEKIKKATFEVGPDDYYILTCCCKEISESEFLDLENIEYYQNKQGDIYCIDCIKSEFDYKTGLQFINDCDLIEEFKEWLSANEIYWIVATYLDSTGYQKHVEDMLKNFCFDDIDAYAEWYVNRKED